MDDEEHTELDDIDSHHVFLAAKAKKKRFSVIERFWQKWEVGNIVQLSNTRRNRISPTPPPVHNSFLQYDDSYRHVKTLVLREVPITSLPKFGSVDHLFCSHEFLDVNHASSFEQFFKRTVTNLSLEQLTFELFYPFIEKPILCSYEDNTIKTDNSLDELTTKTNEMLKIINKVAVLCLRKPLTGDASIWEQPIQKQREHCVVVPFDSLDELTVIDLPIWIEFVRDIEIKLLKTTHVESLECMKCCTVRVSVERLECKQEVDQVWKFLETLGHLDVKSVSQNNALI